jgi:hypothetical protein
MLRLNAFGQRVPCMPRLRFVDPPEGDPPGGGGGGEPVELDGETFDFPTATAVKDMKPEQAAEYWRHQSKVQQKAAEANPRREKYQQYKSDSEELARLRLEQLPKDEREQQEALDEARREGENIGAQRYLRDAIFGRIMGITGLEDDAVTAALEPVDPTYFIDDEGNLDAEKITKFSGSLAQGSGGQGHVPDPVRDAVKRQRPAGEGGGGQSMQERRQAARDRMTKKKDKTTTT